MSEQDRIRKKAQSALEKEHQPVETEKNLVSKFFNRPQHQAYYLRAKQDAVLKHIGDKFAPSEQKSRYFESAKKSSVEINNDDKERNELRKKKELEVRRQ